MPSQSLTVNDQEAPKSYKRAILYSLVVAVVLVGVVVVVLALTLKGNDMSEGVILLPKTKNNSIVFRHGTFRRNADIPLDGHIIVDSINEFMTQYPNGVENKDIDPTSNLIPCAYGRRRATGDKCCLFDAASLGWRCGSNYNYGYESGKPCVILLPEKIPYWEPEYYTTSRELPEEMPSDLREAIREAEAKDPVLLETLWIWCGGETDEDRINLRNVQYSPRRGFPAYYFPYRGQSAYLSPLVGVSFPGLTENVKVHVRCQLWAKNIPKNRGFVRFSILVQ